MIATENNLPPMNEAAVRLVRSLPRPVDQRQVAGFLATCRAHPQVESALDYAAQKEAQAGRADQRPEAQFWGRMRELLAETRTDPGAGAPGGDGRRAVALAQHVAAENLMRLALAADAPRTPPRRGAPANRPTPRPTGEERD